MSLQKKCFLYIYEPDVKKIHDKKYNIKWFRKNLFLKILSIFDKSFFPGIAICWE